MKRNNEAKSELSEPRGYCEERPGQRTLFYLNGMIVEVMGIYCTVRCGLMILLVVSEWGNDSVV